jgi:DNA replication protein DnaC
MATKRSSRDALLERASELGLHGLVEYWDELGEEPWIGRLLEVEAETRARRSLERRVRGAKIGPFKSLSDFMWDWPSRIDREAIEDLFELDFIDDACNVILIGPNGVGKTTIAQNLAHVALLKGHTVRFVSASVMLNDLAAQDSPSGLRRRQRRYVSPKLLVVDEVGYLSYSSQHADLLFDIVNQRSHEHSTVVTTNKPFGEWNEVFPNSSSVVALVDRLVHRSEIVEIDGESFRLKEARERKEKKAKQRRSRSGPGAKSSSGPKAGPGPKKEPRGDER